MTTAQTDRDASLTVREHAQGTDYEVELFGPVQMPDGRTEIGHHFRRYVRSPEMAQAMVRWWLDGGSIPAALSGEGSR